MPRLVPIQSVVIVRGGKRVLPEIGKAYDFEKSEAEALLPTGAVRIANSGDPDGGVMPAAVEPPRRKDAAAVEVATAVASAVAEALAGAKPAKAAKGAKAEEAEL